MVFEGVFTWFMLMIGGVPMAALLGLVTGVLAFIPNIGAITSGVLMVAVGFSAGPDTGVYAIFVYFFVQNIDGYLVVPYIARRTVDLPPALVLAMQLLMGALFGILGVLFADPILATLKVVLVDLSRAAGGEGRRRAGSRRVRLAAWRRLGLQSATAAAERACCIKRAPGTSLTTCTSKSRSELAGNAAAATGRRSRASPGWWTW